MRQLKVLAQLGARMLIGGALAVGPIEIGQAAANQNRDSTIIFLAASKVIRANDDGALVRTLVERPAAAERGLYDGIAIDERNGHIYWTDMGRAPADDGTITRSDLDGRNIRVIVPAGGTFTPKQLKIDAKNGKLYWSDREGMRIMRANLDGSNIETLVETGKGDADRKDESRWCVGIALDVERGHVYWTQKGPDNGGTGTIKRASLTMPAGQTAANRKDIEVLFSKMPEPIDLDLDLSKRQIYWTDRGDNTVSRAPMDPARGFDPAARKDREILVRGLKEAIGIVLDLPNQRMFYTSLGGEVGSAKLDGSQAKILLTGQGTLTGIELVSD